MIGFKINEAQKNFFDRKAVVEAVGKTRAQVLSKGGAFIRRTAKGSMRQAPKSVLAKIRQLFKSLSETRNSRERKRIKTEIKIQQRKASAPPGKPPRSVLGYLKQFLFFAWDARAESVVIGPAKLNGTAGENVPAVLEKGGMTKVTRRRGQRRVVRSVRIAPHPYMGPALAKEAPKLPGLWANAVKP